MEKYAVLGQPVAHSVSPRIHVAFAQALGVRLSYEKIEVAPAELADALARLHADGYAGLNLTLPLKTAAVPLCKEISARARLAGAVNTLIRDDHGWRGDNTDGAGLIRDLCANLSLMLAGRRVLVLGAGGAARGILAPLVEQKPAFLALAGRTPWKPEEVAAAFKALGPVHPRTFLSLKGDRFDLVVNATSAGHQGQAPRLPTGVIHAGTVAYDLNYGAAAQPFLAYARAQGATAAHDGLGMLVEQAAESFLLWRGVRPDTAPVLAALRAA
jgi:shikimate dehydrogenase